MDRNTLSADLEKVLQVNEWFSGKWKDELSDFLTKKAPTADEALFQDVLSDILEHLHRTTGLIRYIGKDVRRTGELSTDPQGNILLGRERLLPLEEFEVYLFDEIEDKMVWKRTFVTMTAQGETPRLAGLENSMPVNGILARTRW